MVMTEVIAPKFSFDSPEVGDHLLAEIIRDKTGRASIFNLSKVVDGWRRESLMLPEEVTEIIALTERLCAGEESNWKSWAAVAAGLIATTRANEEVI